MLKITLIEQNPITNTIKNDLNSKENFKTMSIFKDFGLTTKQTVVHRLLSDEEFSNTFNALEAIDFRFIGKTTADLLTDPVSVEYNNVRLSVEDVPIFARDMGAVAFKYEKI